MTTTQQNTLGLTPYIIHILRASYMTFYTSTLMVTLINQQTYKDADFKQLLSSIFLLVLYLLKMYRNCIILTIKIIIHKSTVIPVCSEISVLPLSSDLRK